MVAGKNSATGKTLGYRLNFTRSLTPLRLFCTVILSVTAFGSVVLLTRGGATQTTYASESLQPQTLIDNQAQPLALASADFDEDGVPDLIAGYASSNGGGIITVQRGNINATALSLRGCAA